VLVERSLHPQFLSNSYLVAAGLAGEPGAEAVFIDAGGPLAPLIAAADRLHVNPTSLLLTHHHFDHVCEAGLLKERWPELAVLLHPGELALLEEDLEAQPLEAGTVLEFGGLSIEPIHTPGHTAGMLAFHLRERGGGSAVFTGDTLFRGSVGGVHASGHTTFADLKRSIMERLMTLDPATAVYPGHAQPTTVGEEWESNPFIRLWRGLDLEQPRPCTALGRPAQLILSARDYDGGTKAWVRWPDGSDDILPGSRVQLD